MAAAAGLWFLAAGLVLFVGADAVYLVAASANTYEPGGLNDSVWVLATVLIGFAPGWQDRPAGLRLPSWALLGVPIVSTLGALALLVFSRGHRVHPIAIGLAAGTVLAALARMTVTFREVTHLAGSHELALTDELTGLGNRRAFYDAVLSEVGATSGGGRRRSALLLLDLDRFKEVNDSLGHHAGDKLLEQVARRLAASVHGERTVWLGWAVTSSRCCCWTWTALRPSAWHTAWLRPSHRRTSSKVSPSVST